MCEIAEQLYNAVVALKPQDGLSPSGLLELPTELADILRQIVRNKGMMLSEIAIILDCPAEKIKGVFDILVDKGCIRKIKIQQDFWYKARFKRISNKISSRERDQVNSLLDDLIAGDY